ncbi:MAG: DUF3575 domain-containing protein [Tidjanibacter sp.]|nr:DUF3575 domain-containing protein [Tidjanibacter sp.]
MRGGFKPKNLLFIICLLSFNLTFGQNSGDSLKIHFLQGSSRIDVSKSEIKQLPSRLDSIRKSYDAPNYKLRNITIIGGASPEGGISLNNRLSEKRAKTLFNHLSQQGSLQDELITFEALGRDWQGLLELAKQDTDLPYRTETLQLLEDIVMKSQNGERAEDNNLNSWIALKDGAPWRYMYKVLFPKLRAASILLSYDKIWEPADVTPMGTYFRIPPPTKIQLIHKPEPQMASNIGAAEKAFYMGLKSNLLYDAALIPNIGIEFYLGRNYSVAANWMYAWWDNFNSGWFWRVYGGDLAVRKWFGARAQAKPLTGHHLGLYAQALTYDFSTGNRGYMGGEPNGDIFDRANFAAGIEYGYSLPIARRLNLDFSVGVGYMWGKYYEYKHIDDCFVWQASKKRSYLGPTKAEISLVWLLGKNNINAKKGGMR